MTRFRIARVSLTVAAIVTSAAAVSSVLPQAPAPDPPATGVIAGQVVDAVSGSIVPGAALTLFAPGNDTWPSRGRGTTADDAGRFEFAGLPPGSYRLSLQADGYVSGTYGSLSPGDARGNHIVLQAGEQLTELSVPLRPVASLSGTVTDERGDPVVGYTVRFLRRYYIGGRPAWLPAGTTKTDDRGRFMRSGSPGQYLALLPAEPPSRGDPAVTHESVFYGGGRTVDTATVITLAPGERRAGLDLVTTFTPRPKMLAVSGVITAPDSVRLFGYVALVRRDAEDPVADLEGFRVLIGQGGRFSFAHVPPGAYRLRFVAFPAVREGASASWGMRTVGRPAPVSDLTTWFADVPLVLERSVTDLEVPLQPGSRIRGRVVIDGRSDLPPADVMNTVLMFVYPAQARQLTPSVLGIPAGAVDAQGRFETMGLPPGKYVLDPRAYIEKTFHVVTSIHVAGREVIDTGIDLGTTDLADVVVTLSSRRWDLTGVVRHADGRAWPGSRVIVFPRDRARRQSVGFDAQRLVLNVAADDSAVFRASGAFPGDYLAAAVANPPEFWMAPEYLETLVPTATPVRLQLGSQQTIELR